MNSKIWYLGQIDLFRGLPEDKLKEIEALFMMKLYCKGHTIYQPDDDNVYIVKTGKVEVSTINADGQKFILNILSKGSIFGNLGVGDQEESFVETLDDSYICFLDKKKFFSIISKEPELSEKLMRNLYDRLIFSEKKAASFATDNVITRFAKLILNLGNDNGTFDELITDEYTHEQIAHMLGVSRQTVTTMVNKMEREGKLKRTKRRIKFQKSVIQELLN